MSRHPVPTLAVRTVSAAASLWVLGCASLPAPASDRAVSWPSQPVLLWREGAVTDPLYRVRPSPPPPDECRGDARGALRVPSRDLCGLRDQLVLYFGPEVDRVWFEVLEAEDEAFVIVPHGRVPGCTYRMPTPPVCFSGITIEAPVRP